MAMASVTCRSCRFGPALFSIIVLGLVAASAAAVQESGFTGRSDPWLAVAASGPVTARGPMDEDSDWSRVHRGDELQPLSELRTGRRGKATLVLAEHILLVRPESEVTLPYLEDLTADSQVLQDSGRVTYDVDGSGVDRFEVVTPYLIAGVKGTVFTVTVGSDGASVSVEEGIVEVRSRLNEHRVELSAGEEAHVRSGDSRQELMVRDTDPVMSDQIRRELQMAKRWAGLVSALRPGSIAGNGLDGDPGVGTRGDRGLGDARNRWRVPMAADRTTGARWSRIADGVLHDREDLRLLALEESLPALRRIDQTDSRQSTRD